MKLEFENGIMRIENAEGLRWQLSDTSKPAFDFDYDALLVSDQQTVRRLGQNILPLTAREVALVRAFIDRLAPPPSVTLQKQTITDLRAFAHGLINSVVTQLEYDGLLDVLITGRQDSTDLFIKEAQRVLTYIDSIWNAFHGLAAQIRETPKTQLRPVKEYAEMMPFPPPMEYFCSGLYPGLFDGSRGEH
jgi:hypothetical protein